MNSESGELANGCILLRVEWPSGLILAGFRRVTRHPETIPLCLQSRIYRQLAEGPAGAGHVDQNLATLPTRDQSVIDYGGALVIWTASVYAGHCADRCSRSPSELSLRRQAKNNPA